MKMSRNKNKISKTLQKRIKLWIQSWIKFYMLFFEAKSIINQKSFVNNFSNFLAFDWVRSSSRFESDVWNLELDQRIILDNNGKKTGLRSLDFLFIHPSIHLSILQFLIYWSLSVHSICPSSALQSLTNYFFKSSFLCKYLGSLKIRQKCLYVAFQLLNIDEKVLVVNEIVWL